MNLLPNRLLYAGLIVCLLAGAVLADDAPPRKGPLANLPSAPGEHVQKILAMGDRSWLNLGAPAPDPKWGAAPGRAYTNKMTWAPGLVGGFLQGEGVHGASGDGPRKGLYNDDVFFYDLLAHRYVCVYPGSKLAGLKLKVDANGFTADADDGQNYPYAIAVHGYECQSYNPTTGEFMTLYTGSPYGKKVSKQLPVQGKASLRGRSAGQHPYFYSTRTGRWERRKTEGPGPSTHFCKTLRYIPGIGKTLYFSRRSGVMWFYDHKANAWESVKPEGEWPKAGLEGTTAYDTKRERLYIFNSGSEFVPAIYDVKTNTILDAKARNQPYPESNGYEKGKRVLGSTSSNAHYDPVADVVVMRLRIKKGTGDPRNIRSTTMGLAIYRPETNEWETEFVPLDEAARRGGSWNSCYSPELNAHVFHIAGDSRTNGEIVLYRHKRRAEEKLPPAAPAAAKQSPGRTAP